MRMPNKTIGVSIYVAVSILERDTELLTTVLSCLQNRSGNHDVTIGVAHVSTKKAFESQIKETPEIFNLPNVSIKHFPIEKYYGIGRSRNAAYWAYSGQDYILQVDAHTYFTNGWDEKIVSKYKEALKVSNNKKTIITGVPEPYLYPREMGHELYFDENDVLGYAYWSRGWWWVKDCVPRWWHKNPCHVTPNLEKLVTETGFAPAIKVCGAFIFCTKELIPYIGLNEDFVFWEEEIVQSIDLISHGFTLMYAYMPCPVFHMYIKENTAEYGHRALTDQTLKDLGINQDIYKDIKTNMQTYFTKPENKAKIKRYEDYAGVFLGNADKMRYFLLNGSVRRSQYEHINVGAFPPE